ncbi:MAG: class II glutamine amidotransferase [bacterium]|nr:class II glutamine amidotransferase [bacterium]
MCRLLAMRSAVKVPAASYLQPFAQVARQSKEYQGHGWGVAYRVEGDEWAYYKNIKPIWEDDLQQFPASDMLIAHVRSAFRDEGIVVENNMPFYDERSIFIFNGELQGVRLREEGRIGAEKIFNVVKRFDRGDLGVALQKGAALIHKRTRHVRAMNIIMTDRRQFYVYSAYAETPAYFQLAVKYDPALVICSEPLAGVSGWEMIANQSFRVF